MKSKTFKKLFSMILVVAMVLSMCPTFVFAEGTSATDFGDYTYVAFGDSIVYGADGDTGERVAKPYVTAAGEILGIGTVLNLARSGSTWTECPPRVNMGEKAVKYNGKADIISVGLGANDFSAKKALGNMSSRGNDTIYGSIHMVAEALTTNYPDAFIFFTTPIKHKTEDNGKYTLPDVSQAIMDVAAVYNIPVLDLYNAFDWDPLSVKDNIHPNAKHHTEQMAPLVAEFIRQHVEVIVSKDACPCDTCKGADATWTAWDGTAAFVNGKHYRVSKDVQLTGVVTVPAGVTVVLDLNGKTITAAADSRCFEVSGELAIVNSTADKDANGNYTGLITGGKAAGSDAETQRGGNICVNESATLKMYGGTIANGTAPNAGGNVKLDNKAKFYMYGGTIADGKSETSGVVGNGGNMVVDTGATFEMHGGEISGGTASASGGNIYTWKGTITMRGGIITGGKANATSGTRGGGNIWLNAASAKLNMYGGEISNGESKRHGGNILVDNASGKITMEGGIITGGKATGHGGSIYVSAGTVQMTGGVLSNGKANWDFAKAAHTTATNDGGNIYMSGGKVYLGGNATITGGSVGTASNQYGGNLYATSATAIYLYDQVQILDGDAIEGKNIYAMTDVAVTMYGGTVKNGNFKTYESGSFHMYGGQIEDLRWSSSGTQETVIYNGIVGSNTSGLPEKLDVWAADCATVTQTTHMEGHTIYAIYQTNLANGACATCGHTYSAAKCGTCKNYSHPAVKIANCEFCDKDVVWAPLMGNELVADHYYLAEDVALTGKVGMAIGDSLCLDLNGHNLTTADVVAGITLTSAMLNIYNTSTDAAAIISGGGSILSANKASGEARPVINIKNITIANGYAVENGGNISVNSVDLIIDNSIIRDGYASKNGGNVCCYAANLTIKGNTQIKNGFACNNGYDVYLGTTSKAQMYSGTVGDICQLNSTGSFHLYGGAVDELLVYNYGSYNSKFYMYGGTVNNIGVAQQDKTMANGVVALYAGTVGNDPRIANYKETTMLAPCACVTKNADGTYTVIHTEGSTPCEACAANDVYAGGYTYPDAFVGQHNYPDAWTDGRKECANCDSILSCEHVNTTLTGNQEATCLAPGYTGDYVCDECGKTTVTGTAIDQLEHNYTYISNGDKTHTVTCDKGCNENSVADCADENGDKFCDLCEQKLTDPKVIVDGVEYETFAEAWANVTDGSEVKLLDSLHIDTTTENFTVSGNVTLDLGGFTLSGNVMNDYGMFYVRKGATLTVKNGTLTNNATYAIGNYGEVVVEANTNVWGEDAAIYNFYFAENFYGKSTIAGYANTVWNCGELNVAEDGVIEYLDNSGAATINGIAVEIFAQDGSDCAAVPNAGSLTIADPSNVTIDEGFILWQKSEGTYVVHAHAHESEYFAATNTENAYTVYTCACGDTYTVVEEGTMLHAVVNEATGESYTDLQAALNAAAKGDTVKLLKDVEVADIHVGAGKAMDLNGFALTVTSSFSASFTTTHITDSSNGEGLLVVDGADVALNTKNKQLPVWTAAGVKFVEIAYKQIVEEVDDNPDALQYRFYFDVADDSILPTLLEENCIDIRVKVNYTTASGMNAYQYFELTDSLIDQYVSEWPSKTFDLTLKGITGLIGLSFTAEIISTAPGGACTIISSAPLVA